MAGDDLTQAVEGRDGISAKNVSASTLSIHVATIPAGDDRNTST